MPAEPHYVIIGNGVAGTSAAETLRKHDPHCRITLFAEEPYPLYNRVSLPKLLQGRVKEEKVFLRTVDFHEQHRIDLHLETRVVDVDVSAKAVRTHDGKEYPYTKLLVATGGRPNRLQVPGGDAHHIYYFQTFDDTKEIIAQSARSKAAVAVGGSYIAYELSEGFHARGLHVTWLVRGPRFLRKVLDEEGGELVTQIAREQGIDIRYGEEVARVNKRDGVVTSVVTTSGETIEADMLGCGLGLTMNTDFLRNSGVKVNRGVVTNEFLETNVPDIYAAGDIAEFYNIHLNQHDMMGTWDNAGNHGKRVALNMLGQREPYDEVPTYSSTLFTSNITVIGMTPENDPHLESVTRIDKAERVYRKLFFRENRLVGAVLIGSMKGRKKLIDLIHSKEEAPSRREAIFEAIL